MFDHGSLGVFVKPGLGLERHRPGKYPAIDLRQCDVHRDVASDQAGVAVGPNILGGGGKNNLQHRTTRRVEWRFRAVSAGRGNGEASGIQDDARLHGGKGVCHDPGGDGVFQALNIERQRIETAFPQGCDHRVYRLGIRRLD